jgi:quercetin dioxygenase-like cupin family protein
MAPDDPEAVHGCSIVASFEDLPVDEPFPGVTRRRLDATGATLTSYRFEPGASFPVHRHPEEQLTLIDEGEVMLRVQDRTRQLSRGAWAVIPGGVEHGITAGPGGARITAIVVPRRATADAYEVVDGQGARR